MKRLLSTFVAISLLLLASAVARAQVGASGEFTSAFSSFLGDPALAGEFQVVQEDGKSYLEFGANFRARSGPDLKVSLSSREPQEVTGGNATSDAVRLGLLKAFEGHQRYPIPAGTDLTKHATVIVHCEKYAKLWGAGSFR